MKTKFIMTAILVLFFIGSKANTYSSKEKSTLVIVHGAWSKASDWDNVSNSLKTKGHNVLMVNLPGHGDDKTPMNSITLQTYVDAVKKVIGTKEEIILVGYSFGGIVISQVAEEIPQQIKKLIYIAAYIPKNGESLLSIAQTDTQSHIGQYLKINESEGYVQVAKEGVIDVFAADAPKPIGEYIASNIQPEPLTPLATPVKLSNSRFGKIKKTAILTTEDHTISIALQEKMAKEANIEKQFFMKSSHTPFIAHTEKLIHFLSEEAK
ncbi:pimeloyl-ACP methyl ester carboxylesterase [Chryseobacterium defluvii]|uniref:Pimeloyl-ACP methyl ester carboxylesterase n=1 Tax=Chryseobacterium defluvii TaxID=160396 RepID=A0A840KF25_9FLAO|nr:alpha/beta hydrolase [Chryseobacterium defluvii]MBB4807175.1 pimeloyl-ACP methyl ester carboxylesterase [Chryseobacterium defluvii]